ncbi:hypothetical protein [Nocardia jiangsuensis]|uniref:DUF732 domain-containing protein n=1 Tax=Nocardia jiangsuensis TaxID=1691563 RepID=A0ABV8DP17_9NOCA
MSATRLLAALCTAAALTGMASAQATAAPAVTPVADFPFDGKGADDAPNRGANPGDRAAEYGGDLAAEIIDLLADAAKCGLSVANPAVTCPF